VSTSQSKREGALDYCDVRQNKDAIDVSTSQSKREGALDYCDVRQNKDAIRCDESQIFLFTLAFILSLRFTL
jgi:hypothetical protein